MSQRVQFTELPSTAVPGLSGLCGTCGYSEPSLSQEHLGLSSPKVFGWGPWPLHHSA